jgi:cysteine synthase A
LHAATTSAAGTERSCGAERSWLHTAIRCLEREALRSADTHLLRLDLPAYPGIGFYLKDESAHPSGSLKHRLARSLFLYALCNGRLRQGQTVIDASSGSTAISEAWFARLLGLPFVAVMPQGTACAKQEAVRQLGGECELLPPGADTAAHARAWAEAHDACYLDQFGLAERATDWRGNNNIAESILRQVQAEPEPHPSWIVCGAGTGGTSATIGRFLRYRGLDTRLCVAEPTGGAFALGWRSGDRQARATAASVIEGIARSRVERGFLFEVVERVEEIDDVDSIAALRDLERLLGRRYGGSSGCNWIACLRLADEMRARGEHGAIVSLLCDSGERYADTLYNPTWLDARGFSRRLAASATTRHPADR